MPPKRPLPKVYAIDGVVPAIDPTAFVHPDATLIGDVVVGPGCYVAPGASLRGDFGRIVLLAGANVQDNCVAHCFAGKETIVRENASIGHGAILHGCDIGARALVGMNAVVMDGVEIGAGSIVAAMGFVNAGVKIPPRSLAAGVPAKVIRELTAEESAWKDEAQGDYLSLTVRCIATFAETDALSRLDTDGPRLKVAGSRPLYLTRSKGK
jgi:phenylacetic acid degradation protein